MVVCTSGAEVLSFGGVQRTGHSVSNTGAGKSGGDDS
jgi:hypothetical protein